MTRLGVVDTTFARFPMGDAAADEYRKHAGADAQVLQRTVPGIKDLAVECLNMFEQQECDLIVACGMVGGDPIDQVCAHEASTALQQVMLATRRHVLEVFVHQIEAADDNQLAWLMEQRTREHALNAYWMLHEPQRLRELAGTGQRQGFEDAGPIGGA